MVQNCTKFINKEFLFDKTTYLFMLSSWSKGKFVIETVMYPISSSSSTCIKDWAAHAQLAIPHNKLPWYTPYNSKGNYIKHLHKRVATK